jgi:hypothetical protein
MLDRSLRYYSFSDVTAIDTAYPTKQSRSSKSYILAPIDTDTSDRTLLLVFVRNRYWRLFCREYSENTILCYDTVVYYIRDLKADTVFSLLIIPLQREWPLRC